MFVNWQVLRLLPLNIRKQPSVAAGKGENLGFLHNYDALSWPF